MRRHFEEQLEELNAELVFMGSLCEKSIALATRMLLCNEKDLKREIDFTEETIDRKERSIQDLCLRLLLKEQPVAGDLRMVSAALRMISDMERIGDQARGIADISARMREAPDAWAGAILLHITDMADVVSDMVTASIDTFVRKNLEMARAVVSRDEVADELFEKIRQTVSSLAAHAGDQGAVCIDLLLIAKYLERIGDHAVNIAEWVEFSLTGHHPGDKT